jgi:hypothetical protein
MRRTAVCGVVDPYLIGGAQRSRGTNLPRCVVSGGLTFAHPSRVRAPAVLISIALKQAQRQEWEEILSLGHGTRPTREKRTAKPACSRCGTVELRTQKEGGVGEMRLGRYSTEDDLAPRFEILQGCTHLGVK